MINFWNICFLKKQCFYTDMQMFFTGNPEQGYAYLRLQWELFDNYLRQQREYSRKEQESRCPLKTNNMCDREELLCITAHFVIYS